LPSSTDKGPTCGVLLIAGTFPNDQKWRPSVPFAEDNVTPSLRKGAGGTHESSFSQDL
jgi:hypothetical protein